jgi:hypothetical protein
MQAAIGQELKTHYGPTPGLPHRMLTILMQINDVEPGNEQSRQVQIEGHSLLGGVAGVAGSAAPSHRIPTRRRLPKLAERAEETREDTRNGANEESPPKTQLCG